MAERATPADGPVTVVLASASPRRRELLGRLPVAIEVREPDIDETPHHGESPRDLVRRLASAKATAVARDGDGLVVAGDTEVVLDGRILGKPEHEDDARRMLTDLLGATHHVVSGFALRHGTDEVVRSLSVPVTMVAHDPRTVDWYLSTGEWRGKAGAYAIQGRGAVMVASIVGDPAAVIGLPLSAIVTDARRLGVELLDCPR